MPIELCIILVAIGLLLFTYAVFMKPHMAKSCDMFMSVVHEPKICQREHRECWRAVGQFPEVASDSSAISFVTIRYCFVCNIERVDTTGRHKNVDAS